MLEHQFSCKLNDSEKKKVEMAMAILKERGKISKANKYAYTKYAVLRLAHLTNSSVLDGYNGQAKSPRIQRELGS